MDEPAWPPCPSAPTSVDRLSPVVAALRFPFAAGHRRVAAFTSEELNALHRLVSEAMRKRGFDADADDVAQEVVLKVMSTPEKFSAAVGDLDANAGYMVRVALNAYLMELRSQSRRRKRESSWGSDRSDVPDGEDHRVAHVVDVLDVAPLTDQQRLYLRQVFIDHRSVADIAGLSGTGQRAVRGVLQRAAAAVRGFLGGAT